MTSPSLPLIDEVVRWPFTLALTRLGLSVALGVFVGLEREHSQKAGVRTFALAALLGCLGGLMGAPFAAGAFLFVAMIVAWMNHRLMVKQQKLALTTSLALAVTAYAGILFGQGHLFTPAVAGIITAALLAWKQPISRFAVGLSNQELRSAILLAILTFIILPVLPERAIDPWGLVEPKANWISVILIAGIGFVNYILLRAFGPRGMEITAFFGGLVNSRKVVVELAGRLRESGPALQSTLQRGVVLATAAMVVRNALILVVLDSAAALRCAFPLGVMFLVSVAFWIRAPRIAVAAGEEGSLHLESPFRLSTALKFGLVFLILNVVGALAQRSFGAGSFYFVSAAGGLLSSGSSIASAANLITRQEIPLSTGAIGIVLSSLTSVLANLPLVRSLVQDRLLARRINLALVAITAAGLIAAVVNETALSGVLPSK